MCIRDTSLDFPAPACPAQAPEAWKPMLTSFAARRWSNYFYQGAPWVLAVTCIILTSREYSHHHIYDGGVARWAQAE